MAQRIRLRQPTSGAPLLDAPAGRLLTSAGDGFWESAGLQTYYIEDYDALERLVPANGAGVHELPSGRYLFGVVQAPAGRTLSVSAGALVALVGAFNGGGFYADSPDAALDLRVSGTYGGPFTLRNVGGGAALRFGNASDAQFTDWRLIGDLVIAGGQVRWLGGFVSGTVRYQAGQFFQAECTQLGQVLADSSVGDEAWGVRLVNCNQTSGITGPLVNYPTGQTAVYGVVIEGCNANGPLLAIGANFNTGPVVGAQRPRVSVRDSFSVAATGGVSCGVIPAGGMVLDGNRWGNNAPFSGFSATTGGLVTVTRSNWTPGGALQPTAPELIASVSTAVGSVTDWVPDANWQQATILWWRGTSNLTVNGLQAPQAGAPKVRHIICDFANQLDLVFGAGVAANQIYGYQPGAQTRMRMVGLRAGLTIAYQGFWRIIAYSGGVNPV